MCQPSEIGAHNTDGLCVAPCRPNPQATARSEVPRMEAVWCGALTLDPGCMQAPGLGVHLERFYLNWSRWGPEMHVLGALKLAELRTTGAEGRARSLSSC